MSPTYAPKREVAAKWAFLPCVDKTQIASMQPSHSILLHMTGLLSLYLRSLKMGLASCMLRPVACSLLATCECFS